MNPGPSLESFLANATGLSPSRALQLYRAGYPWPLFTTQDIRQAAAIAQGKGMLLADALAEVERTSDAEHDEMLIRMAEIEQAQGKDYLDEKVTALASLPCLQEGLDHMRRVITATQELPSTIFRLFIAIQRWAITHPSWKPTRELGNEFPNLVH